MDKIFGSGMGFIFAAMEIADEELRKHKHVDQNLFLALIPSPILRTHNNPEIYRHHVRELIARSLAGEKLGPGTKAEVMSACSNASFTAPLTEEYMMLYAKLFMEILPKKKDEVFEKQFKVCEQWPGSLDEIQREVSRKLFDKDRDEVIKKVKGDNGRKPARRASTARPESATQRV